MRPASGGPALPVTLTALTVLFAVLLGAHLLAPGAANAATGADRAGIAVDVHGTSVHSAGADDSVRHLRHRTQRRVGNLLEPQTPAPAGITIAATALVGAWRDSHPTASAYGAGVASRDTSPAALQVFRC